VWIEELELLSSNPPVLSISSFEIEDDEEDEDDDEGSWVAIAESTVVTSEYRVVLIDEEEGEEELRDAGSVIGTSELPFGIPV
jgi:hypothetical protein